MLVYHQVEKFITANRLFSPHDRVLAAVSGGADSLCLVDCLLHAGYEVVIAHFDHQLRPESGVEAAAVQAYAAEAGCPFQLGVGADFGLSSAAPSLEDAARHARYQFLEQAARTSACDCIATGHHADDHVETLLIHLLRGAGVEGLCGIRAALRLRDMFPHAWAGDMRVVRPLLSCSSSAIDQHCEERELHPSFDSSNLDPRFLRNRVRHELLPLLEELNPAVRAALSRTGSIMQVTNSFLDAAVSELWVRCVDEREDGLWLKVEILQDAPLALQQILALRVLQKAAPPESDIGYEAVERFITGLQGGAADRLSLPGGLELERYDAVARLALLTRPMDTRHLPYLEGDAQPLTIPGVTTLSSHWEVDVSQAARRSEGGLEEPGLDGAFVIWMDAEAIAGGATMRRRERGDRFQPFGMQGSMTLADFFTNEKVLPEARPNWPLLVSGGHILWVAGLRMSERGRVGSQTHHVVRLELRPIGGRTP